MDNGRQDYGADEGESSGVAQPNNAAVKEEMDDDDTVMKCEMDDDDTVMEFSYIERIVHEVENDGEEDDSSLGIEMEEEGEDENDESEGRDDEDREQIDRKRYLKDWSPSDDEFEYDSDDSEVKFMEEEHEPINRVNEGISDDSKSLLSWRLGKEKSFTDWSIQVSCPREGGGRTTKLYHVHRCALVIGPKKSGYFETLFGESSSSSNELEIGRNVAAYFPDFLDYMYCPPGECHRVINEDNWSSLLFLSDYFQIPHLTKAVDKFVNEDMYNLQRLEVYLSEYAYEEDEKESCVRNLVVSNATRVCAEMIFSIDQESALLDKLSPALFLQIVSTVRKINDITSAPSKKQYHVCQLAVEYVKQREDSIDGNYFFALMSELYFPVDEIDAGLLGMDLLKIMGNLSGENVGGIFDASIAILSKYFSICTDDSLARLRDLTSNISGIAAKTLLEDSLMAKRCNESTDVSNISCNVITSDAGMTEGSIIKISCKSSDTIKYLKYLVFRRCDAFYHFNKITVHYQGTALDPGQSVANCGISSGSQLEIHGYRDVSNISCKDMTSEPGMTEGSIIKISCNSFDTIKDLKYLVFRRCDAFYHFNKINSTFHNFDAITFHYQGTALDPGQSVANCGISSGSQLEIHGPQSNIAPSHDQPNSEE